MMRLGILLAVLAFTGAASAAGQPPFTAVPGVTSSDVRFTVTYAGSGTEHTSYRSQPPNPGGKPDSNRVNDSSKERWSLRFSHPLIVPACDPTGTDPCAKLTTLVGATGKTQIVGHIDHVHVDGLFKADNRAERCTVQSHTIRGSQRASIQIAYDPVAGAVDVTALDPIPLTLSLLPGSCPNQGDSFDLLLDNYFGPGFSFASGYGADRWFTSRTVAVPVATLHSSKRVSIPVGLTATGRPPVHCVVAHPTYEQCTTSGSWSGTIGLTAID